jgi:hypothetical protein
MMEPGAAFSNPSSGKIDQQRKILEVGLFLIIWSNFFLKRGQILS